MYSPKLEQSGRLKSAGRLTWCCCLLLSLACTATAVPYTCSSRTMLQRPCSSGWRSLGLPRTCSGANSNSQRLAMLGNLPQHWQI